MLRPVADAVHKVHRYFRRRVPIEEAPSRGVLKLPNELLEYILELVCDPKAKAHIALSQVCRRFRRVAVGHAALWTYISASQKESWRKLQMKNSGDSGLIVDAYTDYHRRRLRPYSSRSNDRDDCPCVGFVKQVLAAHMTWKELRLEPCPILSRYVQGSRGQSLVPGLSNLCLPRLEKLDIDFSFEPLDTPHDLKDSVEKATDILCSKASTWDMPSLKYLTCSIHARDLLKNIDVQLRKVDFVIDRRECDYGESLVLPAVVNVPEISFRVEANGSWKLRKGIPGSQTPDHTGIPCMVHLPHLRTLYFVFSKYKIIQGIALLDAPSLERIYYKECYPFRGYKSRSGEIVGWSMEDLAPLAMRSPKLRLINFEVVTQNIWGAIDYDMEQRVRQIRDRLYSDWSAESCMQREGSGQFYWFRYTLTRSVHSPRLE